MYALDTNTVSYFLRGEGRIAERLLAAQASQVAIPAVALYELRYGLRRLGAAGRRAAAFEAFCANVAVLPFDDAAAAQAAEIRASLERRGQPIGPHDLLIAATALARGATLVTRNQREFARIEGLRCEDWY
jgi:tRNA(fMet)-specific endonuclease VapC